MTINSQMSDAELAAHLSHSGQRAIVDAWNEARKLFEKTKLVALPRRALDAEYDRYRRSGFERPELLPVNVATLRAALKLKEFMTAFWTRWNGATLAEQARRPRL